MSDLIYAETLGADTVASTGLNSLGAGTYTDYLTEVDNTPTSVSGCFLNAMIAVNLGADLTCASGSPYIGVWLIYSEDGTNYPNPPTGTGAVPASYLMVPINANASAVYRRGYIIWPVPLAPLKFKLKLYHGLHGSTAWNSSGNTCIVRRWREASIASP